ncbi:MAG: pentapeptide repeat-containing protein [Chlorobi bacterium]|nr:pentapeptide repeat-containing protein [Chlorobiota bacterium]
MKKSIVILFTLMGVFAIMQGCKTGPKDNPSALFPFPPDTLNLAEFANFMDEDTVASIIKEETKLPNGKTRPKGFVSFPQDGDDFRGLRLDNVYWRGVHVLHGDFRGSYFRSTNCKEGDFSYSDFRVSDMKWAMFDDSRIVDCNFNQAKMFHVHANGAAMDSSTFRGANMFGMEGHHASLRNCDFSHALMKDTEFLHADFTGSIAIKVRLVRAVLIGSKVDSTDFSYSDFTGGGLEGASFVNSRLLGCNFQGAHLQGVDFSGADLKDCYFFGAEFENTVFKDAVNIPKVIQKMIVDDRVTGLCDDR